MSTCTFEQTKKNHQGQFWVHCKDCFTKEGEGACLSCLHTCHKDHNVTEVKYGNFFCDCGANGHKCPKNTSSVPMCIEPMLIEPSETKDIFDSNNFVSRSLCTVYGENKILSATPTVQIMSLLQLAAKGRTKIEINEFLGRENTIDDMKLMTKHFNKDIVKMATMIIVNKASLVYPEYLEKVKPLASIVNEFFTDSSKIISIVNDFTKKNTNGLIKDILKKDEIDIDSVMVLVAALYFKTVWESKFKTKFSKIDMFNNERVTMMMQTGNFPYHEDEHVQILELPYKGREFCMGFILPRDTSNVGMDTAHTYLSCKKNDLFTKDSWHYKTREVEVHVPKFTQRKKENLVPLLRRLGVNDMFSATEARLEITPNNPYVSVMVHEAVVIVDESGTEAAAVTAAVLQEKCCLPPQPKVFYANHSFVYYIRHIETGTLLFVGDLRKVGS